MVLEHSALRRLGRSVVVGPGDDIPSGWQGCARIGVGGAELDDPAATVGRLHTAWATRESVVIELGVDPSILRIPETLDREPHELDPSFELWRERLAFCVWANSYDARQSVLATHLEPVWWWAKKACGVSDAEVGGSADVTVTFDGGTFDVLVDGGPRGDVAGLNPLGNSNWRIWHREEVERGAIRLDLFDPMTPYPHGGQLSVEQQRCVMHRSGPARIIAPAGSGKTRTLTARITHLVVDRGWSPGGICALAYNNKAAAEMRGRLGEEAGGVRVSTMHSLAWRLLRQFGTSPQLADGREVRARLNAAVGRQAKAVRGGDPLVPYIDALSEVRLQLTNPATVEARRSDVPNFAEVFDTYTAGLRRDNLVDFDSQIYEAIRLLLVNPQARTAAQRGCRHLLVDEFQDLNPAYLLLIRLLAGPSFDVFGVGDDDQVLYSHAGASPEYLINFAGMFPGADSHALETNYRCHPDIVAAADRLLRCNRVRIAKTIRAGRPDDNRSAITTDTVSGSRLPAAVLDQIAVRLAEGVPPSEIAVLARVNSALLPIQVQAAERNISVASSLSTSHLERPAIRIALAYLRIALTASGDELNAQDVGVALTQPKRKLFELRAPLERRQRVRLDELAGLSAASRDDVRSFTNQLAALQHAASTGAATATLLARICDTIGLADAMSRMDATDGSGAGRSDDLLALRAAAVMLDNPAKFENGLRGALGGGRSDDKAVQLLSVHRSKGLEWDHVIVVGVNEPFMPHQLATDIEEERRIMHVALTRAREHVVLLSESGAAAPFVAELDPARAGSGAIARVAPKRSAAASTATRRSSKAGSDAMRTVVRPVRPTPEQRRAVKGDGTTPAVAAAVGMRVTAPGGRPGRIVELRTVGIEIQSMDGSCIRLPWGTVSVVDGRHAVLEQPSAEEGAVRDIVARRLMDWRHDTATRTALSVAKVLDDRSVSLLSALRPTAFDPLREIVGDKSAAAYGEQLISEIAMAVLETAGGSPS